MSCLDCHIRFIITKPIASHFDIISPLALLPLYTAQSFTNVLCDWLFLHIYIYIYIYIYTVWCDIT